MTINQHELESTQPELYDMDPETFRCYGCRPIPRMTPSRWRASWMTLSGLSSLASPTGTIPPFSPTSPSRAPRPASWVSCWPARAIEEDVVAGWRPFCVAATVGTTSTTSIDPVMGLVAGLLGTLLKSREHRWERQDRSSRPGPISRLD